MNKRTIILLLLLNTGTTQASDLPVLYEAMLQNYSPDSKNAGNAKNIYNPMDILEPLMLYYFVVSGVALTIYYIKKLRQHQARQGF